MTGLHWSMMMVKGKTANLIFFLNAFPFQRNDQGGKRTNNIVAVAVVVLMIWCKLLVSVHLISSFYLFTIQIITSCI